MSLRDDLLRRFPALKRVPPESYVVGGAIRDLLLGLDPLDVDVAATDSLRAAKNVSERVIRLGTEEHLSAYRVIDGGHVYDFAEILDGDIDADLARRDFTVNAMAVRLADGELLDPHQGRRDLESRAVRMIDPSNFDDDPLRCLKAVRMALRFGFEIDPATLKAIGQRAGLIVKVAPERVTYELSLIFGAGDVRRAVELLDQTGLREPLSMKAAAALPHSEKVSVAGAYALLVDDAKAYAKRWRWSRDLLREVTALQSLLKEKGDLRVPLYDVGEAVARQFPAVAGRAVEMPDFSIRPLLTGEEIAAVTGLSEGPELGRLKRALVEAQIRGEVSSRDDAVTLLRRRS